MPCRIVAVIFALVAALAACATPAAAQKKRAFVVGIDAYQHVARLERAVADARAMAATLRGLGFQVRALENPDRRTLSEGFAAFEEEIEKGDTAFVFFAGHGVEIRAQNLLLPADAPSPDRASEGVLKDAGFLTAGLIERITERGARAAFFVFDACRNNPYAQAGNRRSIGATRGLARVEAPEGVFVLMSAGQNQEALDSLNTRDNPGRDSNANSVFTRILIAELARPGITHIELAKTVQAKVRDLARGVGHAQLPAFYDQIIGNVVLREAAPPAVASAPGPAAPVPPPAPPPPPAPRAPADPKALATECDTLAAAGNDSEKPAFVTGVSLATIDAARAAAACRRAMADAPGIARFAFQLGRALEAGRDMAGALAAYEQAARANHRLAMNAVGVVHARGQGVPQNFQLARQWWERAAALGDAAAMRNIGALHRNGNLGVRDNAEARRWWERAAAAGSATAMNDLGELHLNGIGVAANLVEARRWFEKAAELNDDTAMLNLGLIYANGRGVARNYVEARRWYEKAAALGNATSMNNLGVMYETGQGVARDYTEAWRWYERAARAGDAFGMRNLGAALEAGRGVQKDLAAARQWYERAAAGGNADARRRLQLLRRR